MELWLDRAARERPDALAVNELTYAELQRRAAGCAALLGNARIGRGDRVATTAGGVEFAVLMHALARVGAVLVPVNTRLGPAERERLLRDARPKMVLDSAPRGAGAVSDAAEPAPGDVFAVVYTSGTSGKPKPVELTYGNFEASAAANAANLGVRPGDRWLCCLPLFHVGGLSILTRSAIYGTHAVIHDGFDVERVAQALASERITLISLVATQLRRLIEHGVHAPDLRAALIGGGPVPRALIEATDLPVIPTYGMTETCSQIWTGKPLPGVEISSTDEGELLVRGPMVAAGAIAEDGWLHTGDRGSIDEQGNLTVEGRIADTIVTGGENVSAAEVEEALLAHPDVQDAAVAGRPDAEWGQAVTAFVVGDFDPDELRAHLRDRLAGYKVPKRIEGIDAVPRNAAGKILRGRLPE